MQADRTFRSGWERSPSNVFVCAEAAPDLTFGQYRGPISMHAKLVNTDVILYNNFGPIGVASL